MLFQLNLTDYKVNKFIFENNVDMGFNEKVLKDLLVKDLGRTCPSYERKAKLEGFARNVSNILDDSDFAWTVNRTWTLQLSKFKGEVDRVWTLNNNLYEVDLIFNAWLEIYDDHWVSRHFDDIKITAECVFSFNNGTYGYNTELLEINFKYGVNTPYSQVPELFTRYNIDFLRDRNDYLQRLFSYRFNYSRQSLMFLE
jgi:hypothetical protein